jgi:hypothetical protein
LDWAERNKNNPGMSDIQSHLMVNNGLQGLEVFEKTSIERAVELFRRDGFVVVDILNKETIAILA